MGIIHISSEMAKSARRPAIVSDKKKISKSSVKICKKKSEDFADVNKILLQLKSILPQETTSSFDIMQGTINYINGLNELLSIDDDMCSLQNMFAGHLNFNQQTPVF